MNRLSVATSTAVLALAVVELGIYSDLFSVLILGPWRSRLRHLAQFRPLKRLLSMPWTSNIPGNPYAMDMLSTIIAGPFPSLVDYNACMPNLALPVILVGRPPKGARYWSLQFFLGKAAGTLNARSGGDNIDEDDKARRNQTIKDVDMVVDDDGLFRLAVGDFKKKCGSPCKNILHTESKSALLVMRCFKMKEGSSWQAPALYDSLEDVGVADRERPVLYRQRVSGPFATARGPTSSFERLKPLLILNCCVGLTKPKLFPKLVAAACMARGLHSSVQSVFASRYKMTKCPPGTIVNSTVTQVSGLGGNADHVYWTFCYDATEGDVEISGVLEAEVEGGVEGESMR